MGRPSCGPGEAGTQAVLPSFPQSAAHVRGRGGWNPQEHGTGVGQERPGAGRSYSPSKQQASGQNRVRRRPCSAFAAAARRCRWRWPGIPLLSSGPACVHLCARRGNSEGGRHPFEPRPRRNPSPLLLPVCVSTRPDVTSPHPCAARPRVRECHHVCSRRPCVFRAAAVTTAALPRAS